MTAVACPGLLEVAHARTARRQKLRAAILRLPPPENVSLPQRHAASRISLVTSVTVSN